MTITNRSALIKAPFDPNDIRRAVVANAMSCVDVEAKDKRTRPIFEELLGALPRNAKWPLDVRFKMWKTEEGKWRTQGVSTCGLVAEGIWRRVGVALDLLYLPYRFSPAKDQAIARAKSFAFSRKPRSAWVTPRRDCPDLRPKPGDYVSIFSHVFTAVGWKEDNSKLVSVDGGQADAQSVWYQAIRRREREWKTTYSGATLDGHAVEGWIDVDMLDFQQDEWLVPEGWDELVVDW